MNMQFLKDTICIIPARRGSKRLKLKNLLTVNGKPMIAYSIQEAQKTRLFEKVYVATEDREIAQISQKFGAEVPLLVPKDLCGDKNPSWEPCLYLIDRFAKSEGKKYKNLICLQPNSLLKTSEDIKNAMQIFARGKYDFLTSVTPIDPHYFHWALKKDNRGKWKMYFGNQFMKDRSELPQMWRPNGAIKIAKIEKLRRQKNFFGKNLGVSLMPEERSLAVVTQSDLKIAKVILKRTDK